MVEREEGLDERPEVKPDRYCFLDLPDNPEWIRETVSRQLRNWYPDGTLDAECRATIVSPEHPMAPYPDGIYLEGWDIAPHKLPIPSKAEPFNFPLVRP